MNDYMALPSLRGLVLEDSYVLGIVASPGSVVLEVDLALAPEHPAFYTPPRAGEQLAFARGTLEFRRVTGLSWSGQGAPPATDASGEVDFGGFDSFQWEGQRYAFGGSFGWIEVTAAQLSVHLMGAPQAN